MAGVMGTPIQASESKGSSANMSEFSLPYPVSFPNANTNDYLTAIKSALTVLALSRPDLVPVDTLNGNEESPADIQAIKDNKRLYPNIALDRCGLEPFLPVADLLVGSGYSKFIETADRMGPAPFRTKLKKKIDQLTHEIYTTTGPQPDLEAYVVKNTETLRTKTWGDLIQDAHPPGTPAKPSGLIANAPSDWLTLVESLSDLNPEAGVGKNPYCFGVSDRLMSEEILPFSMTIDRDPQMQTVPRVPNEPGWEIRSSVPMFDVPDFLAKCAPGLRSTYEKCIQPDGSILVPQKWMKSLKAIDRGSHGSADRSPVYVLQWTGVSKISGKRIGNSTSLSMKQGRVIYCRGLFAKAFDGKILSEAALTLSIAASAIKKQGNEGAWYTAKVFDTSPQWENALTAVSDWMASLRCRSNRQPMWSPRPLRAWKHGLLSFSR
jgi:hypothetical protein